jgi:BON domain/PRC-barrel domain
MQKPNVWLATALINDRARNSAGEDLGKIEDFAIDPETGYIQYAILAFDSRLGMGNKLVPIPWSSLTVSPSGHLVLSNIDSESLRRAPAFDRDAWPNMADTAWQRSVYDHYRPVRPVVTERRVYVDRAPARHGGISLVASILLIFLLLGLGWMTYLVSTRGWEQARNDIQTSLRSAAYAAKETSQTAALTTKVKTALSLSKRIPTDKINVDSDGEVVTLRGEVPSEEIRQLAESIARDVPGVSEVRNHLFAVPPPK